MYNPEKNEKSLYLNFFEDPFPWNDEDGKGYRTKPFDGHEYTVRDTKEMGLVHSVRTWNNADITFVYSSSKAFNKIISSNLPGWAIPEGKGDHNVRGIYAIYSLLHISAFRSPTLCDHVSFSKI